MVSMRPELRMRRKDSREETPERQSVEEAETTADAAVEARRRLERTPMRPAMALEERVETDTSARLTEIDTLEVEAEEKHGMALSLLALEERAERVEAVQVHRRMQGSVRTVRPEQRTAEEEAEVAVAREATALREVVDDSSLSIFPQVLRLV